MTDEILEQTSEEIAPAQKRKYTKKETYASEEIQQKKEEASSKKEEPPKARGRKPAKKEVDVDKLAKDLMQLHACSCVFLHSTAFVISEAEAKQLANAISNFSEHYSFNIDPKVSASLALVATAGLIYIPKTIAFREELKQRKLRAQENEQKQ